MQILDTIVAELPHIEICKQDDAAFATRGRIYNTAVDRKPLAITTPQSAKEVADIVKWASRTRTDFSIRAGGHDLFGRALVDNALVIDIRALNNVNVDKAKCEAVIGGGVLSEQLSRALADHGCVTPCPNVATYVFAHNLKD